MTIGAKPAAWHDIFRVGSRTISHQRRDLFGTVQAESANRGYLVTTSHFGPDAHEFAKDKNITLIDGPHLLHLFEKHGYKFRIDVDEARKLMGLT